MRRGALWLVAFLALCTLHAPLPAQDGGSEEGTPADAEPAPKPFSPEQITDMVGPVALYPDDLLAHVLAATTFPDQIEAAYKLSRRRGSEPDPEWDASVQALFPFERALKRLTKDDEWRAALGRALDLQYEDVLEEVQAFRKRAIDAGNLKSTSRLTITIEEDGTIRIDPTDPKKMYVPSYGVERVQEDLTAQASITYGSYYSTRYWTPYYHCWWRRRVIIIHPGYWRHGPTHYPSRKMTSNLPPKNAPVWHPGQSGARPALRPSAAGGARTSATPTRFVSGYRPPRASTRPAATKYRPGSRSAGGKSSSMYPHHGGSKSGGVQRRPSASRTRGYSTGRASSRRSVTVTRSGRTYNPSRTRSYSSSRSRSVYRGHSGSRVRVHSSRGASSRGYRGGGGRGGGGRGGGRR